MRKADNARELHYFSDRLKRKLDSMRSSAASIIEAPSGYGKTTAVRDYLKASVSKSSDIYWFTAVDEEPNAAYRRLCLTIGKIDPLAGKRLFDIGIPNAFTLGETCEIIRSIECEHASWLVIDDFQLLCSFLPPDFVRALIEHGGKCLHIIMVTQLLGKELRTVVEGSGFLSIGMPDLRFQTEDIQDYFLLVGIGLTRQEAQKAFRYTDGWAIAVYLQYRIYRETGAFSESAILPLMERLIWDRLTHEQQDMYLRISPFKAVTTKQLCALFGYAGLPDYAISALANPFVSYDLVGRRYELHSILAGLMEQKRIERGEAFNDECLLAAGDLCRDEGKVAEAFAYYRQAKNFERMLSLDLSHLIFGEIGAVSFFTVALDIAGACPVEIRCRHPLSMLRVAWALKASGEDAVFDDVMAELDGTIGQNDRLRAEWLLLSAYQAYPDLGSRLSDVKQAAALFGNTCSQVILPEAPWCFGDSSQLPEFHICAGEADREADALEGFLKVYSPLTGGHGSGADSLFRAELAYFRGNMAEAEMHAYKATYLAERKRQTVVQLGAAKVLADIAMFHADGAGWQRAISAMERAAGTVERHTALFQAVLDIVRALILNDLQEQERIAAWLKNRDFLARPLMPPMASNALYVHVMYLLQQGELLRFIGAQEAIPLEVVTKTAFSAHLFPLLMSLGHYFLGNKDIAIGYLEQAAQQALPDGLILSFASASWRLDGLVEALFEAEYPSFLDKLNETKAQYGIGWATMHDALASGNQVDYLTPREHEIALFAAEGLRNKEIASKLCISESTVRAHLRTIFQKLDIDRRAKLAERLK